MTETQDLLAELEHELSASVAEAAKDLNETLGVIEHDLQHGEV